MSCKIRSWKVSYYQNDHRRWVYGHLTCSPFHITFHMDSKGSRDSDTSAQGDNPPPPSSSPHAETEPRDESISSGESDSDLLIQYTDIKQVQRATSMLVFPAVTVQTQDGSVHWFSSLPDRYSVFNAVDYFTRRSLLERGGKEGGTRSGGSGLAPQTRIGQQLLRSAEDSEKTLAGAAADLHLQGRQLDRVGLTLMEMHEDLDSADRLLSGLNTYLGQWSLPPQYKQLQLEHIKKDDVTSSDHDLEVLSSELSGVQWRPQKLSVLRVTDAGLWLLDTKQRPLQAFRWMQLSRVLVISPWEVVLTRHEAGRADVSVSVVSSELCPVLRQLERKVSHIMDYQDPPPSMRKTSASSEAVRRSESSAASRILSSRHTAPYAAAAAAAAKVSPSYRPGAGRTPYSTQQQERESRHSPSQLQTTEGEGGQAEGVSAEEASALCEKLGGLKMMARAVGEELTSQNAALDDLIGSVDHADSRVCEATRRTKKLM